MTDSEEPPPEASPTEADRLLRALRERRSMTKAKSETVSRELVEQVIEACSWAPNHRGTEPWRFVVLTGESRERLGEVMENALRRRMAEAGREPSREQLDKERAKPLRAPVLVAVAAVPSKDPKVIEVEEVAATAAGIQNMLLAAQALGLGAMWRTGDAAYDPSVKEFLGFPPEAHVVAFVYLGYPDIVPPPIRKTDARSKTRWM